jgi:hypothetical protein
MTFDEFSMKVIFHHMHVSEKAHKKLFPAHVLYLSYFIVAEERHTQKNCFISERNFSSFFAISRTLLNKFSSFLA